MTGLPKLLDVDEVAAYLGVERKYVRENAREWGGVLVARKWRFTETAIVEELERRRAARPQQIPQQPTGLTVTSLRRRRQPA